MKHRYCLVFLLVLVFVSVTVMANDNKKLQQLLDKEWQYALKMSPVWASGNGDVRYNTKWQDVSIGAHKRRYEHNQQVLKYLADIDFNKLTPANNLNYQLFKTQRENQIEEYQLKLHLMPLTMREGVQTLFTVASYIPLKSLQNYRDWLQRMQQIPTLVQQTEQLMRAGVEHKITQPKIIMERVSRQLAALVDAKGETNPFYSAFEQIPQYISEKEQRKLRKQAIRIINKKIIPAYKKFARFFDHIYLNAAREEVGVSSLPNGKKIYEYTVRYHTTTNLTPEEIHGIGLKEVKRIRAEMEKVKNEVNYKGDLKSFMDWLRTDPQFFYSNADDLFNAYLAISKRIDPHMVQLFKTLPRTPYGLRAIPKETAPDTTTAYYLPPAADGSRAGYYYVNLYKPETRPKWEMEVLSVHEAVPGHHLQLALASELEDVSPFRKHVRATAFVEGWGLYSERLGYDIGLYEDPYSKFGQLTYDMWRAVRLVVDTGMHYMDWSREEAIQYFIENAAKSKLDIINEIDRYIGWPGQALAYKIGQLEISRLRNKAEIELGEHFDVRLFHSHLLSEGALPLNVLNMHVYRWIDMQK